MPIVLTEICNECRIPKSIGWSLQVHTNPLSRPILRIWWWLLLTPVRLFATPWTIAHQVPLPLGFPKQEYWSGLPFPPPGNLPHPGIEPASPALTGGFVTIEPSTKSLNLWIWGYAIQPVTFHLWFQVSEAK